MNIIEEVKNESKIIVSKPHPVVAGIIDYSFCGYSVFAIIALISSLRNKIIFNNIYITLGITLFMIAGIIVYYKFISERINLLSIGELCTGRKIVDGKKRWTNPKGKSREFDFASTMFVFIIFINSWDGMATGKIYSLQEVGTNILIYIGLVIISIYYGQKISKNLNVVTVINEKITEEGNGEKYSLFKGFLMSIIKPKNNIEKFIENTKYEFGILVGVISIILSEVFRQIMSRITQNLEMKVIGNIIFDITWKGIVLLIVNSIIIWGAAKFFRSKLSFKETISKVGFTWITPFILSVLMTPMGYFGNIVRQNPKSELSVVLIAFVFIMFYTIFLHFRFLINYYEKIFKFNRKRTIIFFIITTIIIFIFNVNFYFTKID